MPFQFSQIALQLGAGALAATLGAGSAGDAKPRKPQRVSYAQQFAKQSDAKDISARIAHEFRSDAPRPAVLGDLVAMVPLPKRISEREVVNALMSAHADMDVGQRARLARHIERAGPHPALRAALVEYGPGKRPVNKAENRRGHDDDAKPERRPKRAKKGHGKHGKHAAGDGHGKSRFDRDRPRGPHDGAGEESSTSADERFGGKNEWKPNKRRPETPGSVRPAKSGKDEGMRDKAAKRIGHAKHGRR